VAFWRVELQRAKPHAAKPDHSRPPSSGSRPVIERSWHDPLTHLLLVPASSGQTTTVHPRSCTCSIQNFLLVILSTYTSIFDPFSLISRLVAPLYQAWVDFCPQDCFRISHSPCRTPPHRRKSSLKPIRPSRYISNS
jgi:hypothetical protein